MDLSEEFSDAPFRLVPCHLCGRSFKEDRIAKHEQACQVAQKKRKVFDSTKMRSEGTEINTVRPKPSLGGGRGGRGGRAPEPAKTNNWRQKHEEFVNLIRNARATTQAQASGQPLPPPPPPASNPDYVTCEYCCRRFNQHAAERHIPFCREQASRIRKAPNATAKMKQQTRVKYQPPPPKPRNSAGSSNNAVNMLSQRSPGYGRGQMNGSNSSRAPGGERRDSSSLSSGSATSTLPLRTGKSQQAYLTYKEDAAMDSGGMGRPRPTGGSGGGSGGGGHRGRSVKGEREAEGERRFGYGGPKAAASKAAAAPSHLERISPLQENRNGSAGPSKFCHECGNRHPVPTARFCCMCGVRRMTVQ